MHAQRLLWLIAACCGGALGFSQAESRETGAVLLSPESYPESSSPSSRSLAAARPASTTSPKGEDVAAPRVLLFNQGVDLPIPFDRSFDFDLLPFAGEFRDVTQNGIRLLANGLRHWVHLDGSPLGGRVARQPDAAERWEIDLPAGSHAFEFKLWESTQPGVGPTTCFNFDFCTDTLYRVRVLDGEQLIRQFTFSPYNSRTNTLALWSSVPISRIELTAETNNVDDEFLGDLRVGFAPLPLGFPQFVPSRQHGGFGRHAALRNGRALIGDAQGFEFWQRSSPAEWQYANRLDVEGTIERMALGADHAVLAVATPNGKRLRIHDVQGSNPESWPLTDLAYSGTAGSIDIEGDLIALGLADRVNIYRRDALEGWRFEYALQPDPPIEGASQFGRDLGMDGDLLVVNAGSGLFHVYQRDADAQFTEVFRQEQQLTSQALVDISDATVAVQTFEGGLRIFRPDTSGSWSQTQSVATPLPAALGLGLASGVRIDGDTIMTLQNFRTDESPDFRQVVSIWSRGENADFVRSSLFVDPHFPNPASANLGNAGRAFALDADDLLLGQPNTPWCDVGSQGFFGDDGAQGYANVCAGRAGAVYFAHASKLGLIFASGFEP